MIKTLLAGPPPSMIFWLLLALPFLPLMTRRPMVLSVVILAVIAMQALVVFWAASVIGSVGEGSDGPWLIVFGGIVALSIAMSICTIMGRVGGMLIASRLQVEASQNRAKALGDIIGVSVLPVGVILSSLVS